MSKTRQQNRREARKKVKDPAVLKRAQELSMYHNDARIRLMGSVIDNGQDVPYFRELWDLIMEEPFPGRMNLSKICESIVRMSGIPTTPQGIIEEARKWLEELDSAEYLRKKRTETKLIKPDPGIIKSL